MKFDILAPYEFQPKTLCSVAVGILGAAAVGAATGSMKKDHDNALAMAALTHEKKEADNLANIKQLTSENKFLQDQIVHWKNMLDNQMKAETERAKYGQISNLNITGGATK